MDIVRIGALIVYIYNTSSEDKEDEVNSIECGDNSF